MKAIHLRLKGSVVKHRPYSPRLACGSHRGRADEAPVLRSTTDPAAVTCGACQRTLAMADAELQVLSDKHQTSGRRRRPEQGTSS